jgi:hypothetical protein
VQIQEKLVATAEPFALNLRGSSSGVYINGVPMNAIPYMAIYVKKNT